MEASGRDYKNAVWTDGIFLLLGWLECAMSFFGGVRLSCGWSGNDLLCGALSTRGEPPELVHKAVTNGLESVTEADYQRVLSRRGWGRHAHRHGPRHRRRGRLSCLRGLASELVKAVRPRLRHRVREHAAAVVDFITDASEPCAPCR